MAERRGQSAERLCPCARACVWRAFREQAASKQCGESRRVADSTEALHSHPSYTLAPERTSMLLSIDSLNSLSDFSATTVL